MPLESPKPSVTSIRFEQGDTLQVARLSVSGGAAPTLFATFLLDNGKISSMQETLQASVAGTLVRENFVVSAGYLLSLSISAISSENVADTYCVVSRFRGGVITTPNRLDFLAGYIAFPSGLNYPDTGLNPPSEINWNTLRQQITPPGAGNDFVFNFFSPTYAQLLGFQALFTASAAVANRTVVLVLTGESNEIARVPDRTVITAGQARQIFAWFGPNLPTDNTSSHYIPLPDNIPAEQLELSSATTGIDVADAFTDVNIWYRVRFSTTNWF